jgi:LytR cell envelope-related transcriptional attenuator
MTDAPEGPAEGEPERGSRRSPRVGDSGSPVGSTLSIVLAVIAVIAGFLILRAITNDDSGNDSIGAGGATTNPTGSTPVSVDVGSLPTSVPGPTTPAGPVRTGATVSVANASGVGGSAAAMSTALQTAGYTMGTPGNNNTGSNLKTSVVYYVDGDAAAQAVAQSVATEMGGVQIAVMPAPPPIDKGLGTSTVLVMVGTDTAGKTLADLAAATTTTAAGGVAPPAAVGVTTTTAAGG